MQDSSKKELDNSLSDNITYMQKEVTIMFTDIEDSTQYWHTHGDIAGRLMVDRHNRILFPLVKKFKGRIVKTIGDSIMAVFKKPHHALNAAIAMQQALESVAETEFIQAIQIRIGLHTGKAIVEHNDVYGDVVNVAARVESQSKASEIALSSKTLDALKKSKASYKFKKGEGFIPKGKSRRMALFFCKWRVHEKLINNYKYYSIIPFSSKQKLEIATYVFAFLAFSFFFFHTYLRYFIADIEIFSSIILNPKLMLQEYPFALFGLGLFSLIALYKIFNLKTISHKVFKTLKGGFYACITFTLAFIILPHLPPLPHAQESVYTSKHLIVTVLEHDTKLRLTPNKDEAEFITVNEGTLLLLTDLKQVDETIWNKVRIKKDQYAWVERVRPAAMGSAQTRVTNTKNFSLYFQDIYIFSLSFLGFILGYRRFKVKPF